MESFLQNFKFKTFRKEFSALDSYILRTRKEFQTLKGIASGKFHRKNISSPGKFIIYFLALENIFKEVLAIRNSLKVFIPIRGLFHSIF